MENQEQNIQPQNAPTPDATTFPTAADAEGWYYDNEGEKAYGIMTRVDEQDNMFKKVPLSKGRTAIVRELMQADGQVVASMCRGDMSAENYSNAKLCLAMMVDGQIVPVEDIRLMKLKDYERLGIAMAALNF